MRRLATIWIAGAALLAFNASAEDGKPPFAEKAKPPPPKPEERAWTTSQKGEDKTFQYDFLFKPGIPNPNQLTEVMVSVNEIPKRAHPQFGNRIPQQNADLVIELTSPAGEVVGRYRAHAIPLSRGKYGVHMTPKQDGLYTISVRGTTEAKDTLTTELKLPVNVWPLPKELEGTGEASRTARRRPVKL